MQADARWIKNDVRSFVNLPSHPWTYNSISQMKQTMGNSISSGLFHRSYVILSSLTLT